MNISIRDYYEHHESKMDLLSDRRGFNRAGDAKFGPRTCPKCDAHLDDHGTCEGCGMDVAADRLAYRIDAARDSEYHESTIPRIPRGR